jgi:arylamine N-acetyltransferase
MMMANDNKFILIDYMRRIGLSPSQPRKADLATLTAIMAAQSESIAFENMMLFLDGLFQCPNQTLLISL